MFTNMNQAALSSRRCISNSQIKIKQFPILFSAEMPVI